MNNGVLVIKAAFVDGIDEDGDRYPGTPPDSGPSHPGRVSRCRGSTPPRSTNRNAQMNDKNLAVNTVLLIAILAFIVWMVDVLFGSIAAHVTFAVILFLFAVSVIKTGMP